ncbi:CapA family protein [Emcibacter sp.]|uniref:CapA family protein n=1 Tax=Emcibacter sp. TaxID=1979954 RepID=UPI002AA8F2F2|nr:CapA family protein [Emcibacter sp.]
MDKCIFSLIFYLFFVVPESQAARDLFSGFILDEQGNPVENVSINLNETSVEADRRGYYRVGADQSGLIRLTVSADGFYTVLHSFAGRELARDKDGYIIPPIILVRKKPGRVMMAFGGDAMMGRRFKDPERGEKQLIRPGHERQDAARLLSHIGPYMAVADFASVNMETPLMDKKSKATAPKSYVFFSPTAMLSALKSAGIDFVSLGNNHVNDFVEEGAASTMQALRKSGFGYSGGGMNKKEALTAWRQNINGVRTSHLGFVGWKGRVTPNQVADGPEKSGAAYGSDENIRKTVSEENDNSDLVVMQYHGSSEYSYGPSETTERRMKLAVESGSDLVIGHHPHVVHGFEIYKNKLIAYSLGNFVFDQYRYETHPSAMLYVWMDGEKFHRAEVVPLYIKNYHPTPAVGSIRQYVLRRLADQSAERGLVLGRSGGHAVIQLSTRALDAIETVQINGGDKIIRLNTPWYLYPRVIEAGSGGYRFGRDRLLFGDFEQQGLWGLSDDNWNSPDASCAMQSKVVYSGSQALCLPSGTRTELKNFIRTHDFVPGTPLTLHGFLRSAQKASVRVSLSYWEEGKSRGFALKKGRIAELGRLTASPGEWRQFSIEFPAPEKDKVKGFRLFLENEDGAPAFVDEVSLIEWRAEMVDRNGGKEDRPWFRMDFIEFNEKPAEPAVVKIRGYSAPVATGQQLSAQTIN